MLAAQGILTYIANRALPYHRTPTRSVCSSCRLFELCQSVEEHTMLHCVGRDFLVSAKKVTKEHDKREAL